MDAVIHMFPFTVKLTELIALTPACATVIMGALLMAIAVMIFLKLDVLVSHTECSFYTHMSISVCASIIPPVSSSNFNIAQNEQTS